MRQSYHSLSTQKFNLKHGSMEFPLKFTRSILKNQQQQNRPPYKCFDSPTFSPISLWKISIPFSFANMNGQQQQLGSN